MNMDIIELILIEYTNKDGSKSVRIGTSNEKIIKYWFDKIKRENPSNKRPPKTKSLNDDLIPFIEFFVKKERKDIEQKIAFKSLKKDEVKILRTYKISKILEKLNEDEIIELMGNIPFESNEIFEIFHNTFDHFSKSKKLKKKLKTKKSGYTLEEKREKLKEIRNKKKKEIENNLDNDFIF